MSKLNNILAFLEEIKESRSPVGSTYLSKRLNIPPATVGRILRQLENEGLLKKASNKGRVITDRGITFLDEESVRTSKLKTADKLINMIEDSSKDKLLEILDVRKLLEVSAIESACKNATDEDIEELENILFEHEYEIRHGGLGNLQDLQLHTAISKMSNNTTIYHLLNVILTEDNAYTKFSIIADHIMNAQLDQHKNIVQAIRNRDTDSAKEAMEQHLNQVISDVKKYYK